jgi:hypothetical protein
MMSLRGWIKRLERRAREDLESFELLDGSIYYYDRLETYKELFLEWFKPEDPERAFVNLAELYDTDVLVNERRLEPLYHAPVEDLSE